MTDTDIVRAAVDAYQRQDAVAADRLLARDFVLASPQDDHVDKGAYLEVCFPTADRFSDYESLEMVETANGVLSLYEYELKGG